MLDNDLLRFGVFIAVVVLFQLILRRFLKGWSADSVAAASAAPAEMANRFKTAVSSASSDDIEQYEEEDFVDESFDEPEVPSPKKAPEITTGPRRVLTDSVTASKPKRKIMDMEMPKAQQKQSVKPRIENHHSRPRRSVKAASHGRKIQL